MSEDKEVLTTAIGHALAISLNCQVLIMAALNKTLPDDGAVDTLYMKDALKRASENANNASVALDQMVNVKLSSFVDFLNEAGETH